MQTILTTTGINVANLPLSSRGQTTLLACHDLGKALKESFHLTSILRLKKRQNKTKQKQKTSEQMNKSTVVYCGLNYYRQRYSSSQ